MKKGLYVLIGIMTITLFFSCAQNELVKVQKKAEKLAKEAEKRRKKEEKREAKEFQRLMKLQQKEAHKLERLKKIKEDYDEFLIEYRPLGASTSIPEINDFFCCCDRIFADMVSVNEVIDFIEIKTKKIADEDGIEITEMVAVNKNTGKYIKKNDALKTYATSGVVLANCLLQAKKIITDSPKLLKAILKDPAKVFSLRKKIVRSVKALKISVQVIPLIQRKIKENTEALRQMKHN